MMLTKSITFLFLIQSFEILATAANTIQAPIIETTHGKLLGSHIDDGNYFAFRSIPYAEPPLGTRRFEPPIALQNKWSGVLNSTGPSTKCMQWSPLHSAIIGSEDCLHLNIFTPQLPADASELLPVMVFIHGGGFMWGSADFYGERIIMKTRKMLLVTLNYRLNALGFLSTEDEAIPGNMGLKDQALALQWVHENIARFGGDKEKVILTGWSAGGASVHYHLLSEMTNSTWFGSAVSFSGTALCPCHAIYAGEALKKSKLLAHYMNCTTEELKTSRGIKQCLQLKSAEDIIKQVPRFYKYSQHPFAIFGPVIEDAGGSKSFLTDHIEALMRVGKVKENIPWLVSRTSEDGAFGTAEFLRKDQNGRELIYELNDRWLEVAPILLFFNASLTQEESTKLARELRAKYFGSAQISLETYANLERLYNEELSTKHVQRAVVLFVGNSELAAAYGYVYDNPAPFGFGQIMSQREDIKFGTLHGDDIFLIFNTMIRKTHPYREDERRIAKMLINMLAEFAEKRVPYYAGKAFTKLTFNNNFQFDKLTRKGLNED